MPDGSVATLRDRPRLAFLGIGWIGRHRMEAVLTSGLADACAICDPSAEMVEAALAIAPGAFAADTPERLLDMRPDGILIATPSALHAAQSIQALDRGIAVFCQKPLGRNGTEVAAALEAARRNDRLLGVDFSYRQTAAMQAIRALLKEGAIGDVYAADLVFHNAYGPDKPWFYDAAQSGGGCVMDLGVHLVDLVLWALDFPDVHSVHADLFAKGGRRSAFRGDVEDFAVATLGLETGAVARLACSWRLHAGCDAVIGATFFGTKGALAFSNVGGSFYEFKTELNRSTAREILVSPPDAWGGRTAVEWARRLSADPSYDPDAEHFARVADVLDRIYLAAQSDSTRRPEDRQAVFADESPLLA